ncbi:MAG TPA: tetratricopeptide repeat protein, partial [Aestuariivirgaceae bacterium]
IVVQQGEILTWLGQPDEGIEWIRKAMRLNPYHPERFWHHLARAYFVARRYAEAIEACKRIASLDHQHHALLAACHAYLDNEGAARTHAGETLRLQPDFRVGTYETALHYRNESDREHHREGMLKAGLPA